MGIERDLKGVIFAAVSSEIQARGDKISLDMQERLGREFFDKNNIVPVKVLVWDGHSRDNPDIIDALDEFARKGWMQYHQLRAMWKAREYDVLWMYTHSRGGRSFTLMSWVIENTVRNGARVYIHTSGWIDEKTYPFQIAMGGVAATGDRQKFVEQRKEGIKSRAARGLPVSARIPISHTLIRNEAGKAERLDVNESLRRMWNDLATLLLEGVGWNSIAVQLYERFGHVDESTGSRYPVSLAYRLVMNPLFWGHVALNHKRPHWRLGLWVIDEHEPLPPGVTMNRNVVPPVYTGDQAEAIKAEVRRRLLSIYGSARPGVTHNYAGLVVCGTCGGAMVITHGKTKQTYLYCNRRYYTSGGKNKTCTAKKMLPYRKINAYVDKMLQRLIAGETLEDLYPQEVVVEEQAADAAQALAEVRQRISRLIYEQGLAPDNAQTYYRDAIRALSEREEILSRSAEVEGAAAARKQQQVAETAMAVAEIAEMGLENFWQQEGRAINQLLHRVMGNFQFVAYNGDILKTVERQRARWHKQ